MTNARIESDLLTGYPVEPYDQKYIAEHDRLEYYCKTSGRVKLMGLPYIADDMDKFKLAGLCRHFFEIGADLPFVIGESNYKSILEKYNGLIPKSFEEKRNKILEFLLLKGGEEYREVDIKFETDFTLVYGDSDELSRVISSLKTEGLIVVKAPTKDGYGRVLPTKEGIRFVENPTNEIINLSSVFSKEEKEIIIQSLEFNELRKAIEFIKKLTSQRGTGSQKTLASLLYGDFYTIQSKTIKGTITQDDERVGMAKLHERILIALE